MFSVIEQSRMVNRRGRKMYLTPDFAVLPLATQGDSATIVFRSIAGENVPQGSGFLGV
jgi:hypothetical protein